ncbi:MAG: hypothetical protein GY764_04590 [Halieaceae bacterium]|nr:hypothetical protein [Halieaceae bacterium]
MDNIPVAHRLTTRIHPLPTLRRDRSVMKQIACGATITIVLEYKEKEQSNDITSSAEQDK